MGCGHDPPKSRQDMDVGRLAPVSQAMRAIKDPRAQAKFDRKKVLSIAPVPPIIWSILNLPKLGRSSFYLGINYSVLNEMKRYK